MIQVSILWQQWMCCGDGQLQGREMTRILGAARQHHEPVMGELLLLFNLSSSFSNFLISLTHKNSICPVALGLDFLFKDFHYLLHKVGALRVSEL